MTLFEVNWSENADWQMAAGGAEPPPPQQGDIVSFNGNDAVVMSVSDDRVQMMPMQNVSEVQEDLVRQAMYAQWQHQQSQTPATLDPNGLVPWEHQYRSPPIVPPPVLPEPALPDPIAQWHELMDQSLGRPHRAEHSDEWFSFHNAALAKLMDLYKGKHTEPLHEIPPGDLEKLTVFAGMYAEAKESGLYDSWEGLNIGQLNPFQFLEQELHVIPERLPRRIVLRRRTA